MNNAQVRAFREMFDTVFAPVNAAPSESASPVGADIQQAVAAPSKPSRFERLSLLCDEIAMFRPTYEEAMDIASSLEQGLQSRFNDDLSSDVLTDFRNLNGSLDESDTILLRQTYEPDAYNTEDQDNQ